MMNNRRQADLTPSNKNHTQPYRGTSIKLVIEHEIMESVPFLVLPSTLIHEKRNLYSRRKSNSIHIFFRREGEHCRGDKTLLSDLTEEFFGLLFGFFPFEYVWNDVSFHITPHELAETCVGFIVIRGSETRVPCRFSEGYKLMSIMMSDEEHTSPKISRALFPSELAGFSASCWAASFGRGGE